jgi:hypothetical protein
MKKLFLGYRENMRVEVESDVTVTAKTVADLRALPTWPEGLVFRQGHGGRDQITQALQRDKRQDSVHHCRSPTWVYADVSATLWRKGRSDPETLSWLVDNANVAAG